MTSRVRWGSALQQRVGIFVLAGLWVAALAPGASGQPASQSSSYEFERQLKIAGAAAPDFCMDGKNDAAIASADDEVFASASRLVTESLNAGDSTQAVVRADAEIATLEASSQRLNASWPEDSRFHAHVIEISPLLVMAMQFQMKAKFAVFGIPEKSGQQGAGRWQNVGQDEMSEHEAPNSTLAVYPLHRGPSGHARFLAYMTFSGCAGSWGELYDVREWSPEFSPGLMQVLKQEGAEGLEGDPVGTPVSVKHPFPPAGRLKTSGSVITLPYCYWSRIDFWDNPSLCAADTYDLSGDLIRFLSRKETRPELAVLARALKEADAHEFQGLQAYCASDAVAKRLMAGIDLSDYAENPEVRPLNKGRLAVRLGETHFIMQKQAGGWVVAAVP